MNQTDLLLGQEIYLRYLVTLRALCYQEKVFNSGSTEGRGSNVFQNRRNLRGFQVGKIYLREAFLPIWIYSKGIRVERKRERLEKSTP